MIISSAASNACSSCKRAEISRELAVDAAPPVTRTELRVDRSEGFADIDLSGTLVSVKDQTATVRTTATYRGQPIDVEVVFTQTGVSDLGEVDPDYKGVQLGHGNVELRSIDGRGDPLVRVLCDEYDAGPARRMRPSTKGLLTILEGSVARISEQRIMGKAFFTDARGDSSAELYINFDARSKVLQLHEKDEDYRRNVLSALAE